MGRAVPFFGGTARTMVRGPGRVPPKFSKNSCFSPEMYGPYIRNMYGYHGRGPKRVPIPKFSIDFHQKQVPAPVPAPVLLCTGVPAPVPAPVLLRTEAGTGSAYFGRISKFVVKFHPKKRTGAGTGR